MIRFFLLIVGLIALAILLWLLPLLWLYPFTPEKLLVYEHPVQADAVVVLSGEVHREEYGLKLVKDGYASELFASGFQDPRTINRMNRTLQLASHHGVLVEPRSSSTFSDALYTKRMAHQKGWKTILVVTSPGHSLRAKWIFSKVLPEIRSYSVPVPLGIDGFDVEKAKIPGTWENIQFVSEQKKFLAYYFLYGWRLNFNNFQENIKFNTRVEKLKPRIRGKIRELTSF